jgi:hypothetical protein
MVPRAAVVMLLLRPDDILCVRVQIDVLLDLREGEWAELLDARDGDVGDARRFAVPLEGGVNLPGAQDDALDRCRVACGLAVRRIGDDGEEGRRAGELGDVGLGERVPQQRLGEEDDEG